MRLRTLAGSIAAGTALLAGGIPAVSAVAATSPDSLYVDHDNPDCTDSGAGSMLQPFCDIGPAANLVAPGQTVRIGGYRPYNEQLFITRSGTAERPIVFTSVARDSEYSGSIAPTSVDAPAVTMVGVHDVIIRNLNVQSANEGILVAGSNHVTLDHNSVSRRGGGDHPGIRLTNSSSADVVSRNIVYGSAGAGIVVDPGVSGTIVTTNSVSQTNGGITATDAPGTLITSNTISGGCAPEISLGDGSTGSSVENNVVAPGTRSTPFISCPHELVPFDLTVSSGAVQGTTVDYNIVHPSANSMPYSWAGTGYRDSAALLAGTSQGKHDSIADPLNTVRGLQPGSPAIDSANETAPGELPTDLRGIPAVNDPQVANTGTGKGFRDRGAFERQGIVTDGGLAVSGATGTFPLTVRLNAMMSDEWPGATLSYSYDFGDGTPVVASTSQQVSHVYRQAGVFEPVVTVTDSFGSRVAVQGDGPVRVGKPGPPQAAFAVQGDTGYTAPLSYDFDSSGSRSPWLITQRRFDFGDGSPKVGCVTWASNSGPTCVHTYATPGVYQVTLTVTDKSGATATVTHPVTAAYRPGFLADHRTRIVDTRTGTGAPKGRLYSGGELTVNITGPSGTPYNPPVDDRNATAAVLNLTVVNPDAGGYLTVYPDGQARPTTSNSNFVAKQTVAHLVTVPIGADGKIKIYNHSGPVDVVADLVAAYTPAHVDRSTTEELSRFTAVPPTRVLDTRDGTGTGHKAPVGPKGQACFRVPAAAATAQSLVLNVTATGADLGGYLSDNSSSTRWATSLLYFGPKETVGNQVILPVSNGSACIANYAGHTDVIADITGYYSPTGASLFTPVPPARLVDTRDHKGNPIGQDTFLTVRVTGRAGIPADATGAVLTVTATDGTRGGYLTVYPDGTTKPGTTSVNFTAGQTLSNYLTTGLGTNGSVDIYNRFGTTDAIAYVFGYFTNH